MAFTNISKPLVGTATKKSLIDAVIDDLNDLNSRIVPGDTQGITNGSFELDIDADGVPDGWAKTLYTGGSGTLTGNALADTVCQHGARAYKFTSPGGSGNGGGYLQTAGFIEVSCLRTYRLWWYMQCTVATLAVKVEVDVYQGNQSTLIGTVTPFSQASNNPTAWTNMMAFLTLDPATYSAARYMKLRFIGCHTSSTTAGSTYFDGLRMETLTFTRSTEFEGSGTAATAYSWVCPTGVQPVRVTCIGGGGGGGSELASGNSTGAGGGGSGSLAQSIIAVVPGTAYALSVGGGGAAGGVGAAGSAGGNSTWATTGVVANGGSGGAAGSTGTGGAGGTVGTGAFTVVGLVGGAGVASAAGGDGAGSLMGKYGGKGGATAAAGSAPNTGNRGAGGGGAGFGNSLLGAAGGPGSIILEY